MASTVDVEQVVQPEATRPPIPSRSSTDSSDNESVSSNEDAKTVTGKERENDDNLSISSMESHPDVIGRRGMTLKDDESSKTVYEAWEITYSDDTVDWDTWNVFCGVKFGIKWKSLNDGRIDISPSTAYDQGELADLHEDAIREYEAKGRKKGRSYNQDIANRVFGLDLDIYKRLQHLMDDRQKATNKTPFRRREWRVVVFREGEFPMTDALPERKKSLIRRRRQKPLVHRWFLVLRGEEVKSTKEKGGWRLFHRHSNPWWRVDARESRSDRREYREYIKTVQQRNQRNFPEVRQGHPMGYPMGPPMNHPIGPPIGAFGRPMPPLGTRRI
ncbi:hypothetical protein F4818DRAFT_210244 [Hypoxylon cercidicola]|nr:hypothetical protein F4818DRAFT_210244 [Hypoxylon cercidicola]